MLSVQKYKHSLFPHRSSGINAKTKLYLLDHAFIKQCFKKWKFPYRKRFSRLGACSLN